MSYNVFRYIQIFKISPDWQFDSSTTYPGCQRFFFSLEATEWPSIKPGTWNIPEHAGTFRNIPEHRIIIIIMWKKCTIKFLGLLAWPFGALRLVMWHYVSFSRAEQLCLEWNRTEELYTVGNILPWNSWGRLVASLGNQLKSIWGHWLLMTLFWVEAGMFSTEF